MTFYPLKEGPVDSYFRIVSEHVITGKTQAANVMTGKTRTGNVMTRKTNIAYLPDNIKVGNKGYMFDYIQFHFVLECAFDHAFQNLKICSCRSRDHFFFSDNIRCLVVNLLSSCFLLSRGRS